LGAARLWDRTFHDFEVSTGFADLYGFHILFILSKVERRAMAFPSRPLVPKKKLRGATLPTLRWEIMQRRCRNWASAGLPTCRFKVGRGEDRGVPFSVDHFTLSTTDA